MIIHFNKRTNQFELIRANKQAQDVIDINVYSLVVKGCRYYQSKAVHENNKNQGNQQICKFRITSKFIPFLYDLKYMKSMKEQSLEECVHQTCQNNDAMQNELQEYKSFFPLYGFKKIQVDVKFQMFDKELKYFAIVLEEEKHNSRVQAINLQSEYLSRVFKQYLDLSVASTIKQFKMITKLIIEFQRRSKNFYSKLNTIYCFNLLTLNQYFNYIALVNYGEIEYQQGQIKTVNLQKYFMNLNKFFKHVAKKSSKNYNQRVYTGSLESFRINEKETTQLIINLVSNAIQFGNKNSSIELVVSIQTIEKEKPNKSPNLPDSNFMSARASQGKFDDNQGLLDQLPKQSKIQIQFYEKSAEGPFSRQELDRFVLKLEIKNQGPLLAMDLEKEIILNPQNSEDFYHNNHIPIRLGIPVSRTLLRKLGPYDQIFLQTYNQTKSHKLLQPNVHQELSRRSSFQNVISSIKEIGNSPHSVNSNEQSHFRAENIVSFYLYLDQSIAGQSFCSAVKNRRRSLFV